MGLVKRSHSGKEPAPCGSGEEPTPCGSGEEEPFRRRGAIPAKRSHSGEEPAPCGSGEELTPCSSGEKVPHHILQCDLLLCCISICFPCLNLISFISCRNLPQYIYNNRVMTTQQPQ